MNNYLNIQNSNIFSSFPTYNLGGESSIVKDTAKVSDTNLLEKHAKADTFDENKKQAKSKKRKKILFGSTIASAIFTAGVAGVVLLRGVHGSSFSKIKSKLSSELSKMQSNTPKDFVTKTTYYTRKGAKKSVDTLEATSNFTAIKDWICDRIFRSNKVTEKYADGTAAGFKKVVDKTLGKKYDKVEIKVKDLTSLLKHHSLDSLKNMSEKDRLQEINIKGQTKTLEEWINILSQQSSRLETEFDKSFSLGARRTRDAKRTSLLADLPEKIRNRFFKDKKTLFNPETYKTYATQDLTQEAHRELQDDIVRAKKQITNNITSIHDNIKTSLAAFKKEIKPEDEITSETVKKLAQSFEKFKNCAGENEVKERAKISKEISGLIDDLIKSTKSNKLYAQTEQDEMLKHLDSIKETVLSTGVGSKGSLEEIMTILKGLNKAKATTGQKIISDAQYKEFEKLSSKISKGLGKATELEINDYFIKQAEIKVGSAATDVASVLFPIGVGAYSIGASEGKDEKISTTLTTCIPLVGTFATMVYGTTKMFSGVKNLVFAAGSGLVLKLIGDGCDRLYKKYKDKGSVVNVVKDEYDRFLIDFEEKNTTKEKK